MENHGVDTTRGLIFINPHTELFRKIEQSSGCGEVKYVVEDVRVKISDDKCKRPQHGSSRVILTSLF